MAERETLFKIDPSTVVPGRITTAQSVRINGLNYIAPLAFSIKNGGVYYLYGLGEDYGYGYNRKGRRPGNTKNTEELRKYVREVHEIFGNRRNSDIILGLAARVKKDQDGKFTIKHLPQSIGVWTKLTPKDTALKYNLTTCNWESVVIN